MNLSKKVNNDSQLKYYVTVGIRLPGGIRLPDKSSIQMVNMLLYLSGLYMMEGILTKNNWLRFPPKPKEAKLNIMGRDLF